MSRDRYIEAAFDAECPDAKEPIVKQCNGCLRDLPVDPQHFGSDKSKKDGLSTRCLECRRAFDKKRPRAKTDRNRIVERERYRRNREEILKSGREKYKTNRVQKLTRCSEYESKPEVRERRNAALKKRMAENQAMRDKKKQSHKIWSKTEPGRKSAANRNKRKALNPKYKIKKCIFLRMYRKFATKKINKAELFMAFGYTDVELILHIESQFEESMSWSNHGEWHIDHIIPVSWFEYDSIHDVECVACWSLPNLKPIWREENLSKSNRFAVVNGRKYSLAEWVKEGKPFHRGLEADYFPENDGEEEYSVYVCHELPIYDNTRMAYE